MSIEIEKLSYGNIEDELRQFEADERERLGLDAPERELWQDENPQAFTAKQRATTTILVGGLTMVHDELIQAGLGGLGYNICALECPTTEALHIGKEFGNRGQCNPTYFTVGNLVKKLQHLRDVDQVPVKDLIDNYCFVTAGACGPCRFGTYVTEYRKALRDAGFDGFRVMLMQQQEGLKQATGSEENGLNMNAEFGLTFLKTIMVGDILNALGYKIRPYEIHAGDTDLAISEAKEVLFEAFRNKRSILLAMRRCKKFFAKIKVDKLRVAPKVTIIGEFWAMTTEGDGNYHLQRFLEQEGAEVEVQTVTAWVLYLLWETRYDALRRIDLKEEDNTRGDTLTLWKLKAGDRILRTIYKAFSLAIGYKSGPLPCMDHIADIAKDHYDLELRGGEGHMEVGKLIDSIKKKKAHMVLSVKPFGCMPSSGVSDGVQAGVLAKHPGAIFCPVETTGDAAVNFQSRVQMYLFKARQMARAEFASALESKGTTLEELQANESSKSSLPLHKPSHVVAGTAANIVHEM